MMRMALASAVLGLALASSGSLGLGAQTATTPADPPPAPQGQTTPRQAAAVPEGDSAIGRKLFVSVGCYQCHGYEGQGSSATGPRLAPRPIPYAGFTRYVRQPTGQMPPYTSRIVSDADLAHIYAFVRAQPEPPPVESIPLLK